MIKKAILGWNAAPCGPGGCCSVCFGLIKLEDDSVVHAMTRETIPSPDGAIDHPKHYGGADNTYEAIKVIEAWGLGFCLGNTVKYISRAGKKDRAKTLEDLKKARWYLDREIARHEAK